MIPEAVAWVIVFPVYVLFTYLIGNDPTHIMRDDNSWPYRLMRGFMFQVMIITIIAFAILCGVALVTLIEIYI